MNDFPQNINSPGETLPPSSDQPGRTFKIKQELKVYESREEKKKDFWIGVGLFFGLNVLIFLVSNGISWLVGSLIGDLASDLAMNITTWFSCLTYPLTILINIAFLIYFFRTRTWIGFGMLGTFAALLLMTFLLTIIFSIFCFASSVSSG